MTAALCVAALHSTASRAFVSSFAATATSTGIHRQTSECGSLTTTMEFERDFSTSKTALCMGRGGGVRSRGLEQRREGPTPTGMYSTKKETNARLEFQTKQKVRKADKPTNTEMGSR